MATEIKFYSFANNPHHIGNILERLFDSGGQYANNANGKIERSKHFAVLVMEEHYGYVCPLLETKSGLYWSFDLNPINIICNQLIMFEQSVDRLHEYGETIHDAVTLFNSRFMGSQIRSVITVV